MINRLLRLFRMPHCDTCEYCKDLPGNSLYPKGEFCFAWNMPVRRIKEYGYNTRECHRKKVIA